MKWPLRLYDFIWWVLISFAWTAFVIDATVQYTRQVF